MTELETAPAAALPPSACCPGGLVDPGLAVLLIALAPDLPVLVCGASEDESLGRTLIAAGAEDYLSPADQDARSLARALRHAVERHRLRGQQRRRAEAEDLVEQRESEQRGVGRLLSQTGRAGETARLDGAANLRDSDPWRAASSSWNSWAIWRATIAAII
ncbi:response regulator [uncultured Thiodictyon sp.]|jgi:hypothetical protein|uniref:response regulator n=1 Tax=uncultured Thiodictyon sp. TaxID=1846217 RepID=UPI0025E8DD20|nr:response regulator [uncultured Thiodictyon sp.]